MSNPKQKKYKNDFNFYTQLKILIDFATILPNFVENINC